jgi:threonylcarbamoyladenosine tRNA methylthiotransferase MtaB
LNEVEKTKKVAFQTYGCKLNFAETSSISKTFLEEGYQLVDFKEEADVYVINSCTVTENAEKRCKEAIRRAKRLNPESKVALVGCYAQLRPEQLESFTQVDLILGNKEKFNLLQHLNENHTHCYSSNEKILKDKSFSPAYSIDDRTRTFLKVQDGCDYFCTFCAIPFARGTSRSGTIANTIKQAKEVVSKGQKEIILTGVNIGTFGKQHDENFFDLLKALEKIEGLERIRIGSIEPNLITFEMIDHIKTSKKILPHFHIPLQSGSDELLKKMRRKYDRSVFSDKVKYIKERMPLACVAADVIIGFPGETEEHFMDTFQFIEELPLSYLHVFTYSDRPEAKASKMDDKVSKSDKKDRSERLHQLGEDKKREFYRLNTETTHDVLWEAANRDGRMNGLTENYIPVSTEYNESKGNTIEKTALTNLDSRGEWII